jgi:hypothetical protein
MHGPKIKKKILYIIVDQHFMLKYNRRMYEFQPIICPANDMRHAS